MKATMLTKIMVLVFTILFLFGSGITGCKKSSSDDDTSTDTTEETGDETGTDPSINPDTDTSGDGTGNDGSGDGDGQGTGDNTTTVTDSDGDGVADDTDNCPSTSNASQADNDGDGTGDKCDDDDDNDGTNDTDDEFPYDGTETTDTDSDGVGDNSDNCVDIANEDQEDTDGDGEGDACDATPNGFSPKEGQWYYDSTKISATECPTLISYLPVSDIEQFKIVDPVEGGFTLLLDDLTSETETSCELDDKAFACDLLEDDVEVTPFLTLNASVDPQGLFSKTVKMQGSYEISIDCTGDGCEGVAIALGFTWPCANTLNYRATHESDLT